MVLLEKITPIGINTDISPEAIEHGNQGERVIVNPIIDALNKHYYTSESGLGMKSENVKGNSRVTNFGLPVGNNICIGSYEDQLNNQCVYFLYNSNGNHGVYAYSPETNAIRTLIQITGLNFQNDRRYLITGIGTIGQLLYWSDGLNPQRGINMTRSYTYIGVSVADITLSKPVPYLRPLIGNQGAFNTTYRPIHFPQYDRFDNGQTINKISNLNLQFSYRIKYLDDEYSVIAPYSELSYADFDPDNFNKVHTNPTELNGFSYIYNNQIYVNVPAITGATTPNISTIKQVEILFREGNTGQWKVWKTIKTAVFNNGYFTYNDALIDVDTISSSKLFEAVPNFSKALSIHKNRIFISADQENFDVADGLVNPTITINPRITDYFATNTITYAIQIKANQYIGPPTGAFKIGDRVVFVTNDAGNLFCLYGIVVLANSVYIDTVSTNATHPALSTFSNWIMLPIAPNPYKTYWKSNSIQTFAIAIFDAQGRGMGVVSQQNYIVPPTSINPQDPRGGLQVQNSQASSYNQTLDISIAGSFSASPKVRFMSLVVTEDQFYQKYYQTNVRLYFYRYDVTSSYVAIAGEIIIGGKVFLDHLPASLSEFTQIYVQCPKDMAITIDTTWNIRLLGGTGFSPVRPKIEKILNVIGDFVVVTNFGLSNWTTVSPNLTAEFFIPKQTPTSEIFYEISDRVPVASNGSFSFPTIIDLQGPTYLICKGGNVNNGTPIAQALMKMNSHFQLYDPQTYNLHVPEPNYIKAIDGRFGITGPSRFQKNADHLLFAESPTPTTISTMGSATSQQGLDIQNPFGAPVTTVIGATRTLIMDYTKIAWNMGKAIVDIIDKKAFSRSTVIRFSNSYAQGTNINGLSSFDSGNQYTLPMDRGDITKIVTVGNRLLVVHKFNSTIVFTNERITKNADGSDNLIASDAVVAYDRALQDGGYGSYHPESIDSVDGMVFGYDIYAGVVWRYTEAGQFPISNYGRKEYFRSKSRTYLPNKDTVKIIGGIDRFNKEYIITFNDGTGASETIAFNYEKEKWTTRYSFIPEYYGRINNKFISFNAGQLWIHNENSMYNNFYGVNSPSFIKFAINPHPSWVKDYMAVQLDLEVLSTNPDLKQMEFFTALGQYSYLKPDEFELFEKVFYASILKDVNTNPAVIPGLLALREGDDLRAKYLILQINDDSSVRNSMQMLNLSYVRSEYSE